VNDQALVQQLPGVGRVGETCRAAEVVAQLGHLLDLAVEGDLVRQATACLSVLALSPRRDLGGVAGAAGLGGARWLVRRLGVGLIDRSGGAGEQDHR